MPQLDFIIAFPQIFWLIVIFSIVYTILVHFFCPVFIKILRARKQIAFENSSTLVTLQNDFKLKQDKLNKVIAQDFSKIKIMLEKETLFFFSGNTPMDLNLVDEEIAGALYHSILYYDVNVFKAISLKPMI